jgi:phage-related protein
MPRELTTAVVNEVNASVNRSCWLAAFHWTDELYLTNWPTALVYNGNTYQPFDLQIKSVGMSGTGEVRASVVIGNLDDVIGFYVLNYGLMDIEAEIYLAYVDADGAVIDDPELLFTGRTNGGSLNKMRATINVVEDKSVRLSTIPHRFICAETGFNHVPPKGMIIEWNGERYRIKDF